MNPHSRTALALWMGLLVAGSSAAAAMASPADQEAARQQVSRTVDDVVAILRNDQIDTDQKLREIQDIAYERFDFGTISKLVLARNYRRMTPQQRSDFEEEFKRHLSKTYGKNLDRYSDENVEITETRPERNGDVTVRTQVVGGAEPILVDYRLRGHDGTWYVIDVIIENVSLLSNFRSQTQEIISREGPDGLIRTLREKNDEEQEG